jgi:hypothetical protein
LSASSTNLTNLRGSTAGKGRKKALIAGAIAGGVLSLAITLLMDILLTDSSQGSWRGAISLDLERAFSVEIAPEHFIVYFLFLLVLVFMTAVGGGIGACLSLMVYRFLRFLGS